MQSIVDTHPDVAKSVAALPEKWKLLPAFLQVRHSTLLLPLMSVRCHASRYASYSPSVERAVAWTCKAAYRFVRLLHQCGAPQHHGG